MTDGFMTSAIGRNERVRSQEKPGFLALFKGCLATWQQSRRSAVVFGANAPPGWTVSRPHGIGRYQSKNVRFDGERACYSQGPNLKSQLPLAAATVTAGAGNFVDVAGEGSTQNVPIGFAGEPVPPRMGSGAAVSRNSHRFRAAAASPSASRLQLSKRCTPR